MKNIGIVLVVLVSVMLCGTAKAGNEYLPAIYHLLLTSDVTAPTTVGSSVFGTTDTATTLSVTINEDGTGYYLVRLATDTAPSVAEVLAGTSFAMTANTAATQNITGLNGSTDYKIYFIAKDTANNTQTVMQSAVFTTSVDVTAPETTVGLSVSGTTDTATTLSITINEDGTGYYLVRLATDTAPSVAEVLAGTSFAMTANTAATQSITGLTVSTDYQIWFVAKDIANNIQAVIQNVGCTPWTLLANTAPTFVVSDGKVTTDFGSYDSGESVALQSDGKILVAGYNGSNSYDFALARYNSDGSLDTSFDTDGKLTTDFGSSDSGQSVALQSDGKILVAGTSGLKLALARYNSDGSLDTSFDTDGKVTTIFGGSSDSGQSVTLQLDGKILVAGYSYNDFALARYNSDGSLDTSFDTDGKLTTNFGSYDYGMSVALQLDGKILVAGYSGSTDFTLARYNSDGSLDTSFDTDGKVTTDFGRSDVGKSVALQLDGKILVAGYSEDFNNNVSYNNHFALARYNSDGSLDTSFDTDGKVTTIFGRGQSVALQTDGKILVAGHSEDYYNSDFTLARYNSDGSLDTSFDTDGKVTTDFAGSSAIGQSVALQADGKILVAGGSDNDFALARYNSDGSLDNTFSPTTNTLAGNPIFQENQSPTVLAPKAQILDVQLAVAGNYAGATLTLARHGGASSTDFFSAQAGGTLSALTTGGYFSIESVTIGRTTTNANGTLTLAFNSNATQGLVDKAMQQIAYANSSDAPPATVQIDWTFNDGNIGAQGIGGPLATTGFTTVQITPTNDVPISANLIANQIATTGVPYTYTLPSGAFRDPDLEPLTYSLSMSDGSGVPPWLTINATTGTISGTPDPLDVGTLNLRVTARDSANATATDDFQFTITTPN